MLNKNNHFSIVVVGAQWGDEGKGKISDFLAQNADYVVRYQGGNNAGHSIEFNNKKFTLQHIPSGIFNKNTMNIMAQGMVINPKFLLNEISILKNKGVNSFKLAISDRAHVIMPYHIDLDKIYEKIKFNIDPSKMIGTTQKGIGPAYADKINRIGIRFIDFINLVSFKEALRCALITQNKLLKAFNFKEYNFQVLYDEYKEYAKLIKPFVTNTNTLIDGAIKQQKKIIFEGAQGVMLCLENGTYPYVTSSSPTASAIPLNIGYNFSCIQRVIGIVKAYTTRVGEGFFPTEISDSKITSYIRKEGNEYGTVTNRPRRIGWLDIVALKHAIMVSGINELAITLLDVLDFVQEIKIGLFYKWNNKKITKFPANNLILKKCKVHYITLKGWMEKTKNVRNFHDLPKNAKLFLKKIENLLEVKITMFSVGPDREQTVLVN